MKPKQLLLSGLISTVTLLQTAKAYEPPTHSQITRMLANPKIIVQLIGDANGTEVATLMQRIITRIKSTEMSEKQQNYLIAFYVARAASILNNEDAETFAKQVVASTDPETLPIVFAGLAVGRGGSSAFVDLLIELAGDNEELLIAIRTPNIPLSDPVYTLLVGNFESAQSRPPTAIDSLPPPIPVGSNPGDGGGTPPPPSPPSAPPIPEPYDGQTGN